jgi:peptide chain release factor 1
MKILRAKIYDNMLSVQKSTMDEKRNQLIGTGDRSEKSRTYNYPQNRITHHDFNISLYKLQNIMEEGNLDELLDLLNKAQYEQIIMNFGK